MRLWSIVLTLSLAGLACQADEPAGASTARLDGAAAPIAPLSASALQVSPDQLSRIELSGGRGRGQRIVLTKTKTDWQIVSPLTYRASPTAVEAMVAVLAEIEILDSAPVDPRRTAPKHGVDRGVQVKAWAGDHLRSHFIIGNSTRERTYVKPVSKAQILTVRGRCLPIFNKTVDELRYPIITNIDRKEIVGVRYENQHGVLELSAETTGREADRGFVPKGKPIRNFNRQRASQQVGVLAHLFAKGFVDAPVDRKSTGLFDEATARATLLLKGTKSIDVWAGKRTPDGRLYLRTSETKQLFLVSAHLETSLVPQRSHFERSDEMMRQLKAKKTPQNRPHTHEQAGPPASQVPAELMTALRALARKQRNRP